MFLNFFLCTGAGFIIVRVSGLIEVSLNCNKTFLEDLLFIYILEFALVDVVVDFAFCFLG